MNENGINKYRTVKNKYWNGINKNGNAKNKYWIGINKYWTVKNKNIFLFWKNYPYYILAGDDASQ